MLRSLIAAATAAVSLSAHSSVTVGYPIGLTFGQSFSSVQCSAGICTADVTGVTGTLTGSFDLGVTYYDDIRRSLALKIDFINTPDPLYQFTISGNRLMASFSFLDSNGAVMLGSGGFGSPDLHFLAGQVDNIEAIRVDWEFTPGTYAITDTTAACAYDVCVRTKQFALGQLTLTTISPVLTVPEPGTYALLLAGLAAVWWPTRRRSED